MKKTIEDLQSEIISAICHPNKIRILKALRKQSLCNCELMPLLGLEQSNLSRHLKSMEKSGILISWKEGLRVNYRIADERIFDLLDIAEKISLKKVEENKKVVAA
ncbi:MAG: metalloregulator ArsR/SmtB family transcription factor [Melioribacteraceae bacterium]|nr:metalloregulator ArsR/SmtB family transcription factor [Melioribacteraceae bacterium]